MKKNKIKLLSYLSTAAIVLGIVTAVTVGAADYSIPRNKAIFESVATSESLDNVNGYVGKAEGTAKVLGIPLKDVEVNVIPAKKIVPCGDVFGVKFFTKGVMIVGMSDIESTDGILNPAHKSGLKVGDVIVRINGKEVNTVEEVSDIVEKCNGEKLTVEFDRNGENGKTSLIPLKALSDGKYRTGLWIRDSTAGIGTMTYYCPETGEFGGLGHGICDIDTGMLMPMMRGNIVDIEVTDIIKGYKGNPGEIKGNFGILKIGELYGNTEMGVFGILNKKPICAFEKEMKTASSTEIKEGEAYLYTSLGSDKAEKYKIELTKIYRNDSKTKNFIFSVKDEELINKTGGIVQGMSGSPIVQNGKLIGAVTHVLVNDSTKGYGIFIENMLAEAEKNK